MSDVEATGAVGDGGVAFNLDAEFLGAILSAQDGSVLRRTDPDWLQDKRVVEAFRWCSDQYEKLGELPPLPLVEEKFGLALNAAESVKVLWGEVKQRAAWMMAKQAVKEIESAVLAKKPGDAIQAAEQFLDRAKAAAATVPVSHVSELAEKVWWAYQAARDGTFGWSAPWPGIDDALGGGVQRGDVVVMAARTGVGKTFAAILTAIHVARAGAKVILVSTEMGQLKTAQRLFAMLLKVEPRALRTGKLGGFADRDLPTRLLEAASDVVSTGGSLLVAGDDFHMDVGALEGVIQETRPDYLVVDGLYLIRAQGNNRVERMANVADAIKKLAKRYAIGCFVTHQFNRAVDPNSPETFSLDRLGLSDVVGWNADAVFALVRTEVMQDEGEALIIPLKIRDGTKRTLRIKWDIENADFSQISSDG